MKTGEHTPYGHFEMSLPVGVGFALTENTEGGVDLMLVETATGYPIPGCTLIRIVHNPYTGLHEVLSCGPLPEHIPFRLTHDGSLIVLEHPPSGVYDDFLQLIAKNQESHDEWRKSIGYDD